jgi:hypothetical protein
MNSSHPMHRSTNDPTLLALAFHSSRVGFAIFRGSNSVVDWGTYAIPRGSEPMPSRAQRRIVTLLVSPTPTAIAVKRSRSKSGVDDRFAGRLGRFVRSQARELSIPVIRFTDADVRQNFRTSDAHSKYDRAKVLISIYPELDWKLPPKRKAWESEPRSMMIFEAVELGFVFWRKWENGRKGQTPPLC